MESQANDAQMEELLPAEAEDDARTPMDVGWAFATRGGDPDGGRGRDVRTRDGRRAARQALGSRG
jgi:hypothetical protein